MKPMINELLVFFIGAFSMTANAKLLFEGYYRIEIKGQHVGYVVQRDEIDDDTKLRTVTYVVWQNVDGHITQDVLKATAKSAPAPTFYKPLKFTNWQWYDNDGTVAVGRFINRKLFVKKKTIPGDRVIDYASGKRPVPPKAIFSCMVLQIMAERDPDDYTAGRKASFVELDEEEQKFDTGTVDLLDTKVAGEQKIAQVVTELRNDVLEGYTFSDGQMLGSRNDYDDKIVYLVKNREEALGDFSPSDMISKVFGEMPLGLRNPVSESQGALNAKAIIESFVSLKVRKEQKYGIRH